MRNLTAMFQRRAMIRLGKRATLVPLVLMLQGVLVFPLLSKTDAQLHNSLEAEHLCLQMGRRTRSLQELHLSQPKFDVDRLDLIVTQLREIEPKLLIKDDRDTRQQLLTALKGNDCSFLERLWLDYSRQNNSVGVKSRGEFYALFLKATAKSLDPYSDYEYFSKFDQMQIPSQNAHQILGLIVLERKDYLLVNRILPFTAAEKEGSIRAGDKIVAIAPKENKVIPFSHEMLPLFQQYLRSQPEVVLLVQRDEAEAEKRSFTVTITKEEVATRRAFSYVTSVGGQKVGIIKLPSFYVNYVQRTKSSVYEGAAPDVLNAIKTLQQEKVAAILLDLRGNLGGDKDESLTILGYFLGKKVGLKTHYTGTSQPKVYQTLAEKVYDGSMAVLINPLSASASEILAGAIQDSKRGLILGENSYGKWTVQNVFVFPGFNNDEFSGSLRVTVGETMTPLEHRYPLKGLKPDVLIKHSSGNKDDEQLRRALEVLVESGKTK
jgi:carboxyl-terminal processing protease